MITVNAQTMREVAPRLSGERAERQAAIIAAVGPALQPTLEAYAINTRLRVAHFLGQTCQESAGFSTTEEFASGDAYEGRKDLGNTQPGDGRRYKGRGLLQLTGRNNYREYGKALGVDLEGDPARAADPVLSLRIACEYWKRRDINPLCDNDDVGGVTKKVNGGTNGLADRRALTEKAKEALKDPPADVKVNPGVTVGPTGRLLVQILEHYPKVGEIYITSAYRPGEASHHGGLTYQGSPTAAVDIGAGGLTPEGSRRMRDVAKWLYDNFADLTVELIHTTPYSDDQGFYVKNQHKYPNGGGVYDRPTMAEHRDHVHFATSKALAEKILARLGK